MLTALTLNLLLGLVAQQPDVDTPAGRLEFMRASLEKDPLHRADEPDTAYRLKPDPVLRFNNPVGTVHDGAIFVWLGPSDRPVAAVQVFHHNTSGNWHQEFSSLTDVPLSAGRLWGPVPPGVEFKPVPGAPKPADTPERRLRQMHELTRSFSAEDAGEKGKVYQKLRLLPRPFARYGKPDTDLIDGALFAYVETTDPEVYLMLEARRAEGGYEWQYAFAPATVWPVKGLVNGREVWSLPYRQAWLDRRGPFYVGTFANTR